MHFGDALALAQEIGNGLCILAMPLHAQRQTFQSLKEDECIERAHAGSEISQQGNSRLVDLSYGTQGFCGLDPDGAVVAGVRLGRHGTSMGMSFPVKFATIYKQAAYGTAMSAEIFGTGIHNIVRPMGERFADDGRCGVVHEQRNSHVVTNVRHFGNGKSL